MNEPLPPVAPSYDPAFAAELYAIRGPGPGVKAFTVAGATVIFRRRAASAARSA